MATKCFLWSLNLYFVMNGLWVIDSDKQLMTCLCFGDNNAARASLWEWLREQIKKITLHSGPYLPSTYHLLPITVRSLRPINRPLVDDCGPFQKLNMLQIIKTRFKGNVKGNVKGNLSSGVTTLHLHLHTPASVMADEKNTLVNFSYVTDILSRSRTPPDKHFHWAVWYIQPHMNKHIYSTLKWRAGGGTCGATVVLKLFSNRIVLWSGSFPWLPCTCVSESVFLLLALFYDVVKLYLTVKNRAWLLLHHYLRSPRGATRSRVMLLVLQLVRRYENIVFALENDGFNGFVDEPQTYLTGWKLN